MDAAAAAGVAEAELIEKEKADRRAKRDAMPLEIPNGWELASESFDRIELHSTDGKQLVRRWRHEAVDGTIAWCCRVDTIQDSGATKKKIYLGNRHGERQKFGSKTWFPLVRGAGPSVICEGESDADALIEAGYTAITWPLGCGAVDKVALDRLRESADNEIVAWCDPDERGRKARDKLCKRLKELGFVVYVVRDDSHGAADLEADEVRAICDDFQAWPPRPANLKRLRPMGERWDEVIKPPVFQLPDRLRVGEAMILAAEPGTGKSLLSVLIAVTLATGASGVLPDAPNGKFKVALMAFEDSERDLRGRMRRAASEYDLMGSDNELRENIAIYDEGSIIDLAGTKSAATVEAMIDDLRGFDVCIIDPMVLLFGDEDENSNSAAARLMQNLTTIAKDAGISILVVDHVRKRPTGTGLVLHIDEVRAAGSKVARARAVDMLGLIDDGTGEGTKAIVWAAVKRNNSAKPEPTYWKIKGGRGKIACLVRTTIAIPEAMEWTDEMLLMAANSLRGVPQAYRNASSKTGERWAAHCMCKHFSDNGIKWASYGLGATAKKCSPQQRTARDRLDAIIAHAIERKFVIVVKHKNAAGVETKGGHLEIAPSVADEDADFDEQISDSGATETGPTNG